MVKIILKNFTGDDDIMPKHSQNKCIIMLLIDSLMYPALAKAIQEEQTPALKFFIEKGNIYKNVVSPFPTMSVNVDSSLLTGVYADIHQIPGLVWFHEKEKRLINYGSHIRELIKLGLKNSLKDIFYNINNVHLNPEIKTIHEELDERGKTTASINGLLYRGNAEKTLTWPFLFSFISSLGTKTITKGTNPFVYGSFAKISPSKKYGHFWSKYGFNDSFSTKELSYLIKKNKLPDFSMTYFPDMDQIVHKKGPMDTSGIKKVDQKLQRILNIYPSWEEALKENIWIIIGDNGQASIDPNKNKALIDLRKLLHSFHIMKLRDRNPKDDQIVLGVNERMAFIYSLNLQKNPISEIIKPLQTDDRIDVIAYLKDDYVHVLSGAIKGELIFKPNGPCIDQYEQSWEITGDLEILDLSIENLQIQYHDYPDALARLYSSLKSHSGNYVVISAKPGFEFVGEGSPTHIGGASHGGLHKQDSLVPMIVAGTNRAPKHLRLIDLKDWILSLYK